MMKLLIWFTAILCSIVFIGILLSFYYQNISYYSSKEASTTPTSETDLPADYPAGAVIMVGHWANTPVASTTALIREYGVGGVIIMSAPEDPNEILNWTREWQAASKYPLIIAIDQEGGLVNRLKGSDFIQTSQPEIATEEEAYEIGKTRGKELATLGINMNFAPVLDTATSSTAFMYERVFPSDTDAARLAAAMTRGMGEESIIAAAKHFPGHPNSPADSHYELPTVTVLPDQLDTFTTPFREYITLASPAALMTAHVSFPNIADDPATLSYFFLTDYLRNTLGFNGLIITDDMSMDAIDGLYSVEEASIRSIAAGADMVLLAAIPEDTAEVIAALVTASETDKNLNTRLGEAKSRVWMFQQRLLTNPNNY